MAGVGLGFGGSGGVGSGWWLFWRLRAGPIYGGSGGVGRAGPIYG